MLFTFYSKTYSTVLSLRETQERAFDCAVAWAFTEWFVQSSWSAFVFFCYSEIIRGSPNLRINKYCFVRMKIIAELLFMLSLAHFMFCAEVINGHGSIPLCCCLILRAAVIYLQILPSHTRDIVLRYWNQVGIGDC